MPTIPFFTQYNIKIQVTQHSHLTKIPHIEELHKSEWKKQCIYPLKTFNKKSFTPRISPLTPVWATVSVCRHWNQYCDQDQPPSLHFCFPLPENWFIPPQPSPTVWRHWAWCEVKGGDQDMLMSDQSLMCLVAVRVGCQVTFIHSLYPRKFGFACVGQEESWTFLRPSIIILILTGCLVSSSS